MDAAVYTQKTIFRTWTQAYRGLGGYAGGRSSTWGGSTRGRRRRGDGGRDVKGIAHYLRRGWGRHPPGYRSGVARPRSRGGDRASRRYEGHGWREYRGGGGGYGEGGGQYGWEADGWRGVGVGWV